MFTTARQRKLTQKIIDQIRTAILDGRLKPGDRLAPEKELTAQFQVSKQTLRESLRALEHMGLIDIRKGTGGGVFIVEVDIEVTKQSLANFLYFKNLSIENLSEVRKLIEPHAARKAAQNISKPDLMALEDINVTTRAFLEKGSAHDLSRHEIAFHRIIAGYCGNPILVLFWDFAETLLEDFKKLLKPDRSFSKAVLNAHENIFQALYDRHPHRAADEMLKHVNNVEQYLCKLKTDIDFWRTCRKTGSD